MGHEEGYDKGLAEGREEGREEVRLEMAKKWKIEEYLFLKSPSSLV